MTLNGNGGTYGDLASAEIFRDFTGDPALEATLPGPQETLAALGGPEGEINGVPYALNANGVIYNVDVFEELDLEVPGTWSELIETAEAVEAAGRTPFYFTWQEAWTTLPAFNAVTQNTTGRDLLARAHQRRHVVRRGVAGRHGQDAGAHGVRAG